MPRIAVLISDTPDSALHERARALFSRLPDIYQSTLVRHKGNAPNRIRHFLGALRATSPDLIYMLDPIYAAVAATRLYCLMRRTRVVLDTGDLVYELAKEVGRLGAPGLTVVRWAEQTALRMAQMIVVRSIYHREWLAEHGHAARVAVIPDGVDLTQFYPTRERLWRERLGIRADEIVVGGVGSIIWNARRRTCFGWDLIEAMPHLRDLPVRGLLIGDGDGRPLLEARARELGISDRVIFAGRVPYAELNAAINALDIALLSAPDSPISWVRTTGKLPLYLACDRYVVATAVGEASRLLQPYDMLLAYNGIGRDETYPARLAQKIGWLAGQPEQLRLNGLGVRLAQEHFDYNRLAQTLADVITGSLA